MNRLLAVGGVAGPAAFIGAWAIAGSATANYSAVNDAISDLAAVHAPMRALMTAGFVVYGLGLIAFGIALREALEGRAWMAAVATGACTLGVAATPLGGWSGDAVHGTFAGLGYAALVALQLLAVTPLARRGRVGWARVSGLTAVISATCLAASALGPAHGLFQRLGLTIGDAWIVVAASVGGNVAAGLSVAGAPGSRRRSARRTCRRRPRRPARRVHR